MPDPAACRFSESHEWFAVDGDVVTVGITPYAVNELTDITYVEMQPKGTQVQAGESVGEVESVKTTSDVYAAIDGEIVEVNDAVADDPSLINSDPMGDGWLVRLRASDTAPLDALMDFNTYRDKYPV